MIYTAHVCYGHWSWRSSPGVGNHWVTTVPIPPPPPPQIQLILNQQLQGFWLFLRELWLMSVTGRWKLWWNDGFAETTSSSVLARLSWRRWSFIQQDMSIRHAEMQAAIVRSSGWIECHQHSSDMKAMFSEWQKLVKPCRQKEKRSKHRALRHSVARCCDLDT